ncbi:CLUMA_CG021089, isoform A [Clunio marinus]|uniref:CLUMA_CG021089, isoform A n=1 Tax=Clunio marinus TaxID=568069 RepID=A0A1J1J7D5_9DIPT|nr:CLUMA_CG021089, isoform A [Clunio marinus]
MSSGQTLTICSPECSVTVGDLSSGTLNTNYWILTRKTRNLLILSFADLVLSFILTREVSSFGRCFDKGVFYFWNLEEYKF